MHVGNDLYTLITLLHRCVDAADHFALFACAQHAYGTRVYSGVTCDGVSNCVCAVTMYRVCVVHVVDAFAVSLMHNIVLREVDVLCSADGRVVLFGGVSLQPPVVAAMLQHMAELQALHIPQHLEATLQYPPFQRQILSPDAQIPDSAAGALKELYEVYNHK
jgi:hypothetical protein